MYQQISRKVAIALGHYVYALVDPRNNQIFYVGKARANSRAEQHLKSVKGEEAKGRRIQEIIDAGFNVRIDILRHGMDSEKMALEVEASIIDAIGLGNLTNAVRGHAVERGRIMLDEAIRRYGSAPLDVASLQNQKYVLFFIGQTYFPTISARALYDITRQYWYDYPISKRVGNMDGYVTALAVYDSTVVAAYEILTWHPAGTTPTTRNFIGVNNPDRRWEFEGDLIQGHPLLNRRLTQNGKPLKGTRRGYSFIP